MSFQSFRPTDGATGSSTIGNISIGGGTPASATEGEFTIFLTKNKCVFKFRIVMMMMHVLFKLSVFHIYRNAKAQSVLTSLGKAWHAASAR